MGFYLEIVLVGTKGQAPNAQDPKEPKKHTLDGAMTAAYRGVAIGKLALQKYVAGSTRGQLGWKPSKIRQAKGANKSHERREARSGLLSKHHQKTPALENEVNAD